MEFHKKMNEKCGIPFFRTSHRFRANRVWKHVRHTDNETPIITYLQTRLTFFTGNHSLRLKKFLSLIDLKYLQKQMYEILHEKMTGKCGMKFIESRPRLARKSS